MILPIRAHHRSVAEWRTAVWPAMLASFARATRVDIGHGTNGTNGIICSVDERMLCGGFAIKARALGT